MTDRSELRERIAALESIDGDGTELVTVTVPPGKSVRNVRIRIRDERASATQITADRTRTRVRRALGRVERLLSRYEETPANGLAIYAGVVEGDLVSAVFDELPTPLETSTYWCDDRFDVEPLRDVARPGDAYGLIVVERGVATVGRLVGQRLVEVTDVESHVMGHHRAGGQSARRFARERERQKHEFFGSVADVANDAFVGEQTVTGVVVGGTLDTVESFVAGDYLDHRLADRLLDTYAVEHAGRQGLRQLVDRAESRLLDAERRTERETLDTFFQRLRTDEAVAYGRTALDRAIQYGAVDTALVSTSLDRERRTALEGAVTDQGGTVVSVATSYERGARFAEAFDGVGALLRFPVN